MRQRVSWVIGERLAKRLPPECMWTLPRCQAMLSRVTPKRTCAFLGATLLLACGAKSSGEFSTAADEAVDTGIGSVDMTSPATTADAEPSEEERATADDITALVNNQGEPTNLECRALASAFTERHRELVADIPVECDSDADCTEVATEHCLGGCGRPYAVSVTGLEETQAEFREFEEESCGEGEHQKCFYVEPPCGGLLDYVLAKPVCVSNRCLKQE